LKKLVQLLKLNNVAAQLVFQLSKIFCTGPFRLSGARSFNIWRFYNRSETHLKSAFGYQILPPAAGILTRDH